MTGHTPPPTSYTAAEKISPYQLLIDLHEHAIARPARPSSTDLLAELALAAAVVAWWRRWQPAIIHAALRAGADLPDIAAATGLDPSEVIGRWQRWAEVQTGTDIGGHPLLDPDEVRTIHHRIAKEVKL
ncbi:hypothetical protein [Paractinoplanes rishiriensis]|uniref:Uncharacterized protein n=1 Tax=Paractinoplanes rishiriensis TaxID=1050105 RepID=A0A919JYF8_9ACTN|nr:hypothetical protein [Actinoplanes rishiriensis]GIE95800.1 hypothetical protein Ari01nite_32650 [Actinoplanes rishiriensis]